MFSKREFNLIDYPKLLNILQKKQTEILDFFVRICNKYKLTYWLSWGSALGAHRHKGFIPWDQDIDVDLPIDDFVKLIDVLKYEIMNSKYVCNFYMGNNKNCPYPTFFIKLGVRKSKVLQYRGDKEKNTFSIDIFACFNVSDDVEKCKILNDKIQKLAMEFNKFRKYNDIQSCDKHRNYFAIINLLQYENNLNIDQHTYATFEIGDIRIFKKNTFFPLKELEFEGKKHPVPGNIEDYLVNLYGKDWQVPKKRDEYRYKIILDGVVYTKKNIEKYR